MTIKAVHILLLTLLTGPALAQTDQIMPAMGGPGGGQFFARCSPGEMLNGVDLRVGDDVDAIRPVCIKGFAPTADWHRHVFDEYFGGVGGQVHRLSCPDSAPSVVGLDVAYEGEKTVIINNVHLFCGLALPNQALTTYPTLSFDGPVIGVGDYGLLIGGIQIPLTSDRAVCPAGLVSVGINGRFGIWLDAVSLICGALPYDPNPKPPRPTGEPVKSIGRVNTGGAPPKASASICDSARDALSRQSPASPNLVAQCRAAGGSATSVSSNEDLENVRLRGEYMANMDDAAGELRNRTTGGARRGFEIGLGIWGDQTAPGPGKQRYHDALTTLEQQGFDLAASYALPKNQHAKLIAVGSAIARADEEVATARRAEPDVFFSMGFDIASGLFGDPAAGSEGSKVMGPGAMAIRNALTTAGRRGFDASTKLHLSRTYP
jgi:hypothetical protein